MAAKPPEPPPARVELATFGQGCYWCAEAVFQRLAGVVRVESGFAGGQVERPTYRQVCAGGTGHAEVIQVTYDPAKVRYEDLLEVFWKTHDPTTPDQQGNDVGPQYRSIILTHDARQRELAEAYRAKLDASGAFDAPIVTEIAPFTHFWRADDAHQDYYNRNSTQPYCRVVIGPKLEKLKKVFAERLN